MWNHSKSLVLTIWWVRIVLVCWTIAGIGMPFVQREPAVLVFFYLVFVPLWLAGYYMARMLGNIQKGIVFSTANTANLRLASWACFFAAVFLLVGACIWPVLILAAGVIGFLGLFVRVMKNMLAEAILLKEENDYTI